MNMKELASAIKVAIGRTAPGSEVAEACEGICQSMKQVLAPCNIEALSDELLSMGLLAETGDYAEFQHALRRQTPANADNVRLEVYLPGAGPVTYEDVPDVTVGHSRTTATLCNGDTLDLPSAWCVVHRLGASHGRA
jgi:hypothetical protein